MPIDKFMRMWYNWPVLHWRCGPEFAQILPFQEFFTKFSDYWGKPHFPINTSLWRAVTEGQGPNSRSDTPYGKFFLLLATFDRILPLPKPAYGPTPSTSSNFYFPAPIGRMKQPFLLDNKKYLTKNFVKYFSIFKIFPNMEKFSSPAPIG